MSKLKVLCLNSLTDGPALSLSGSKAMLAALTNLLRGKGLLERVDLGNCNVKELSSDDGQSIYIYIYIYIRCLCLSHSCCYFV